MAQAENFWGGHDFCWACRVLHDRTPELVAIQGQVAILINPFAIHPGHALVVPLTHVESIHELPGELAGPVLACASRVATTLRQLLGADGITLRQNNGAASDQHLFHFHLHVIPRFFGDEERFAAAPPQMPANEQLDIVERLRLALG